MTKARNRKNKKNRWNNYPFRNDIKLQRREERKEKAAQPPSSPPPKKPLKLPPKELPPPTHPYNTRRCPNKPEDTENQQLAAQRSQDDLIYNNADVQDFDNGDPVSPSYLHPNKDLNSNKDHEDKEYEAMDTSEPPPNEQQPNEESSSIKISGRRRISFSDYYHPRPIPRPRKLSYEDDSKDALMNIVDINDNESELSDFVDEDPYSIPNTSEDDDYEYEDIREYLKFRNVLEPVYTNYLESLNIMQKYLKDYWGRVKLLNESRSNIINELNGQLSKSKKFSKPDVIYFNDRIRSIESNLNASTPVISKFKATYVRDSQKQQVLYQGFKFSKHYHSPNIYKCTYDDDPNWEMFGYLTSCNASLTIDEKGFLQPGSFVTHYHGRVKEGYNVRDLASPKIDPVVLPRLTPEGDIAGKRFKLNQFITAKLHESVEYINKVSRILPKKYLIDEQLEKLRLLNGPELEEKEQNYLSSYIQWIEHLLQHIRIINVANGKNIQVGEKEATNSKGGGKGNNKKVKKAKKKQRKGIKKNF